MNLGQESMRLLWAGEWSLWQTLGMALLMVMLMITIAITITIINNSICSLPLLPLLLLFVLLLC